MKKIKNVLICGLGAIGGFYAAKIYDGCEFNLRILADKARVQKYISEPRIINGKEYNFEYVLPDNNDFMADLIIIATKSSGIDWAIKNIKNFVHDNTIILSLLNGIDSENKIADIYGKEKVIYSYLIGHTFFRNGREIDHDGNANIVFGSVLKDDSNIDIVREFFENNDIKYILSDDILNSQWNKFCFNCCVNQISAITRKTFGEIKSSIACLGLIKNMAEEISLIGKAEGVSHPELFYSNTLKFLDLMIPDGKTSMLQDIEASRNPEIDIFGETIIKLAEKHNINVPYNKIITDIIKTLLI